MNNKINIQGILGIEKKNPGFTIYRQKNMLYVYLGMGLIKIIPDDKTKPAFKIFINGPTMAIVK